MISVGCGTKHSKTVEKSRKNCAVVRPLAAEGGGRYTTTSLTQIVDFKRYSQYSNGEKVDATTSLVTLHKSRLVLNIKPTPPARWLNFLGVWNILYPTGFTDDLICYYIIIRQPCVRNYSNITVMIHNVILISFNPFLFNDWLLISTNTRQGLLQGVIVVLSCSSGILIRLPKSTPRRCCCFLYEPWQSEQLIVQ